MVTVVLVDVPTVITILKSSSPSTKVSSVANTLTQLVDGIVDNAAKVMVVAAAGIREKSEESTIKAYNNKVHNHWLMNSLVLYAITVQ